MYNIEILKTTKEKKQIEGITLNLSETFGELDEQEKRYVRAMKKYYTSLMQIRLMRKENGLTQKKLSEKSGVPRTTIAKIESGNRNVTINTIMKLASAMGKRLEINLV